LITTGFKLASPKLFKEMWTEGSARSSCLSSSPSAAIVLTDLLTGVLIGLGMQHPLHPAQQSAPPAAPRDGKARHPATCCASSWRTR
jgi:hypothetical protein